MKDLLSIEERKVSALVVALIATLVFALFRYITKGDIPATLATIIQTEIVAVAGVNGVNALSSWGCGGYYGGYNSYPTLGTTITTPTTTSTMESNEAGPL